MKIVFDGRLRYVCPHCGEEQKAVLTTWKAWGVSEVSFSVEGGRMKTEDEIDTRNYVDIDEEGEYSCPDCDEKLTVEDVMGGLKKWLEKLKKEDPEEYAEIIAELL